MDKTCWFCSDFSVWWCAKVGIEDRGDQRGAWAKRVGRVTRRWVGGSVLTAGVTWARDVAVLAR